MGRLTDHTLAGIMDAVKRNTGIRSIYEFTGDVTEQ